MYIEDDKDADSKYKDAEINRLTLEVERLTQVNNEKDEFLTKLGITCPSEMKRISRYIDEFREENSKLRDQVRKAQQDKLMIEIALDNAKSLLASGSQNEQNT